MTAPAAPTWLVELLGEHRHLMPFVGHDCSQGNGCTCGTEIDQPAMFGDYDDCMEIHRAHLAGAIWAEFTCHCGDPVTYGYDGNAQYHRGMCEHCDAIRCDAYPGECGR